MNALHSSIAPTVTFASLIFALACGDDDTKKNPAATGGTGGTTSTGGKGGASPSTGGNAGEPASGGDAGAPTNGGSAGTAGTGGSPGAGGSGGSGGSGNTAITACAYPNGGDCEEFTVPPDLVFEIEDNC